MRHAARKDLNHNEIQSALEKIPGCTVRDVSHLPGLGYDLKVCFRGLLYMIEIKDGKKPPSARELTKSEAEMASWPGWKLVKNVDEALQAIGAVK